MRVAELDPTIFGGEDPPLSDPVAGTRQQKEQFPRGESMTGKRKRMKLAGRAEVPRRCEQKNGPRVS